MIGEDDPTQTSAPDTVVDPAADPALDATELSPGDGPAPPHQVVIHTAAEGLPAPGERVGRYELGQVIGRGGMGVVYEARDPELDRPLAIKVVLPATAGKRSQQRLLDEARAMAKLRHPSVVPVFDVGTTDRGVYVVMPLLAGGTLHDWATRERRTWREVLARYLAAGRGLAAAHAVGLVHRDFKPRNVLLGDGGEVMVGDFGLAEDTLTPLPSGGPTSVSSPEGTPAYMAPEHAAGEPVDARADQFSFCVSLWEGLHGERPTEAATRQGGVLATSSLPSVPAERRGAPGWLLMAVARGWESSPDRRWPSMNALLDHIEGRLRRPRRIAFGAAALGILGIAAAVAWMAPAKREDPCPVPRARLATAWSPALRSQIETAFTATGLPYAPDTLARILPALDRYADDWRKKHIEVCRAGNVEKTQSAALLDRRMACLDRRFAALRARTTAFAVPTPAIVQDAVGLIEELPALADCDDAERLLAYPMPTSPEIRGRISGFERKLDEIDALTARGEGTDITAQLEQMLPEVRALDFPPVHDRVLAELVYRKGNAADVEPLMRERIDAAARARNDLSLAAGWLRLAMHLETRSNPTSRDEVDAIIPMINSAVIRAGSIPTLAADANSFLIARALNRGDHDEALRLASANVALTADAHAYNNLGNVLFKLGRPADAVAAADKAVELITEARGARHPDTAGMVHRLAQVTLAAGDADRAASLLERAVSIQRGAYGAHPDLARSLVTLGNVARARGDTVAGKKAIEEAVAIFEKAGDRYGQVTSLSTLAELVVRAEGITAARPHYDRSLQLIAELRSKDDPHYCMVEANLATALANADQCAEALPLFAHGIQVLEAKKDPRLSMILGASAICDRNDPVRALVAINKYQTGIAGCAKLGCPPDVSLAFRTGLGMALYRSKRDPADGLRMLREARTDAVKAGIQPVVDDIDRWTTKHHVKL